MHSFLHNWDNCGHGFTHAFPPLILTASGSLGIQASTSPMRECCPRKVTWLAHATKWQSQDAQKIVWCQNPWPYLLALIGKDPVCRLSCVFFIPLSAILQSLLILGTHFSPLLSQVWRLHPNLSISIGWLPSPSQPCILHHQALLQTSESSFSPSTAGFLVRLLALDTDSLVKIPALSLCGPRYIS